MQVRRGEPLGRVPERRLVGVGSEPSLRNQEHSWPETDAQEVQITSLNRLRKRGPSHQCIGESGDPVDPLLGDLQRSHLELRSDPLPDPSRRKGNDDAEDQQYNDAQTQQCLPGDFVSGISPEDDDPHPRLGGLSPPAHGYGVSSPLVQGILEIDLLGALMGVCTAP
jgi:hypothetical protein